MEEWIKPSINRMAKAIGIPRMGRYAYSPLMVDASLHLKAILKVAVKAATAANRKTIQPEDVLLLINTFTGPTIVHDTEYLPKYPFKRNIIMKAKELGDKLRFAPEVFDILRKFTETHILTLLNMCLVLLNNTKRVTLMTRDAYLVSDSMEHCGISTGAYRTW